MQLAQSDTTTKRDAMTSGARVLAQELIREPVKEAVKEALREEADVRAADEDRGGMMVSTDDRSDGGGSGGPSMGMLVLGLAVVAGAIYALRQRGGETEQSTWSEFEDERDSGPQSTGYSESASTEHTGTAAGESGAMSE
ncbi:hypothetical protein [Halosimplex sp. J119]